MKIYLIEDIDLKTKEKLKMKFEFTQDLKEADILITRNLKVNKECIDNAIKLKLIAIHGTGISEVDIKYANEKGICVFNTPYQNYESVAEFGVMLAIEAARKKFMGTELYKKNACILGNGHIGKRTEEILRLGYQVNTRIYKRNDDLKEALKNQDFVFICMSLNPDTYHFINDKTIPYMKKGVILVNTARGAIVDEMSVIKALKDEYISCYATDVFEDEPLKMDNPLLKENVVATPHIASNTKEALGNIGNLLYEQIMDFINGKEPKYKL